MRYLHKPAPNVIPIVLLLILSSFFYEVNASTAPPMNPVRLIFIHHSTGENWLNDDNGGLGVAFRDNNYFVSDTNYDWGPDNIGSNTDIGHWWLWFRGENSATYLNALYTEGEQHSWYTRLTDGPSGENQIIMFKSCFPNSALKGNIDDEIPEINSNPLRGEDCNSEYHTVANAKGIYIDLLEYFRTRPDKLFVVITAPPLTDTTYANNARAFNNWLVNDWLTEYTVGNVFVFDYFNVLTSNGGNANINDLESESGNHHRWWNNQIQHKIDGDNDGNPNILEYPTQDDHPSQAGTLKATAEFVPLLNMYYNIFLESQSPSSATPSPSSTSTSSPTPNGTATPSPTIDNTPTPSPSCSTYTSSPPSKPDPTTIEFIVITPLLIIVIIGIMIAITLVAVLVYVMKRK